MPLSAGLSHQIDDLALKLVMGEPESGASPCDWIAPLQRIREAAEQERAVDVLRAADAFMAAVRQPGAGNDVIASRLQEGIACLQQAAERGRLPDCDEVPDRHEVPDRNVEKIAVNELRPAQDPELLAD